MPNLKLFFGNQPSTSKFPPIIEFFVQRIQTQFSNYVYEDLSRPPTYDKPVYTLSPAEAATATDPLPTSSYKTPTSEATVSTTESTNYIETDGDLTNPSTDNNNYGTLVVYLKNSTKNGDLNRVPEASKNVEMINNVVETIDLTYNNSMKVENVTNAQKVQNNTVPVLLTAVLNITIQVPVLVTNQTFSQSAP